MCELLGLSSSKYVYPTKILAKFRERGRINRDGWGIAYYPPQSKSAVLVKEPKNALESELFEIVRRRIYTKLLIGHVRSTNAKATINYDNTHPFVRELGGRDYIFAHNGWIPKQNFKLDGFKPIGRTVSEHLFCYILRLVKEKNIDQWTYKDFKWLHEELRSINQYGKINCLMSDGLYLFAYRCIKSRKGLHYLLLSLIHI